jgi:hypothetical protein
VQLALLWREAGDPKLINWMTKAHVIASVMGNLTLINVATALQLWLYIESGQSGEEAQPQLKELLAWFEPRFANSLVSYVILLGLSGSSIERGAYQEAIQYGNRALNIAKSWQDLHWIGTVVTRLTRVYLHQGLPHEAGLQLLDGMEWHLALGQDWQMLGFLGVTSIVFPELVGGDEATVTILSMMYHHPELIDNHRGKVQDQSAHLREDIGPEAFAAAWEQGKGLDIETVVAQLRLAWT